MGLSTSRLTAINPVKSEDWLTIEDALPGQRSCSAT